MLDLRKDEVAKPKCHFSNAQLPHFLDHEQPPTKKRPFCTILNQTFSHTLDILVPDRIAEKLQSELKNGHGILRYVKVHMKLREVIDGDFFNTYIKTGNILMLSEGRPGIDRTFSLSEGILRLELDKASFESAGLQGKPVPDPGRKHAKTRYAIELNLRLPSMVRGRRGFERIVWAFKEVLTDTVTWLFYDLNAPTDGTGPIAFHQPIIKQEGPQIAKLGDAVVPRFCTDSQQTDRDVALETLEFLTLAMMLSPRLQKDDKQDPYLSRYQVPTLLDATETSSVQDLIRFRWHGLVPSSFIYKVVLSALKASGEQWVAVGIASFGGSGLTALFTEGHGLTWEYNG